MNEEDLEKEFKNKKYHHQCKEIPKNRDFGSQL